MHSFFVYIWSRPPSLHPPWVGGVGGGVGHYQPQGGKGEDLIWGQYTEACKDEDIGMNIQGHYQPEGGRGRSHIGAYVCI